MSPRVLALMPAACLPIQAYASAHAEHTFAHGDGLNIRLSSMEGIDISQKASDIFSVRAETFCADEQRFRLIFF